MAGGGQDRQRGFAGPAVGTREDCQGAAKLPVCLWLALVSAYSSALQGGGDLGHPGLGGPHSHLPHHPYHAVAEGKLPPLPGGCTWAHYSFYMEPPAALERCRIQSWPSLAQSTGVKRWRTASTPNSKGHLGPGPDQPGSLAIAVPSWVLPGPQPCPSQPQGKALSGGTT